MSERSISWQHALQFSYQAQLRSWTPRKITAEIIDHTTLILLPTELRIRLIRDWVVDAVEHDFSMSAIFDDTEVIRTSGIVLPHLIRFSFTDHETSMFFKLTWG